MSDYPLYPSPPENPPTREGQTAHSDYWGGGYVNEENFYIIEPIYSALDHNRLIEDEEWLLSEVRGYNHLDQWTTNYWLNVKHAIDHYSHIQGFLHYYPIDQTWYDGYNTGSNYLGWTVKDTQLPITRNREDPKKIYDWGTLSSYLFLQDDVPAYILDRREEVAKMPWYFWNAVAAHCRMVGIAQNRTTELKDMAFNYYAMRTMHGWQGTRSINRQWYKTNFRWDIEQQKYIYWWEADYVEYGVVTWTVDTKYTNQQGEELWWMNIKYLMESPTLWARYFNNAAEQITWKHWSWKTGHRPHWVYSPYSVYPYPPPTDDRVGYLGRDIKSGDVVFAHYITELIDTANFVIRVIQDMADDEVAKLQSQLVVGQFEGDSTLRACFAPKLRYNGTISEVTSEATLIADAIAPSFSHVRLNEVSTSALMDYWRITAMEVEGTSTQRGKILFRTSMPRLYVCGEETFVLWHNKAWAELGFGANVNVSLNDMVHAKYRGDLYFGHIGKSNISQTLKWQSAVGLGFGHVDRLAVLNIIDARYRGDLDFRTTRKLTIIAAVHCIRHEVMKFGVKDKVTISEITEAMSKQGMSFETVEKLAFITAVHAVYSSTMGFGVKSAVEKVEGVFTTARDVFGFDVISKAETVSVINVMEAMGMKFSTVAIHDIISTLMVRSSADAMIHTKSVMSKGGTKEVRYADEQGLEVKGTETNISALETRGRTDTKFGYIAQAVNALMQSVTSKITGRFGYKAKYGTISSVNVNGSFNSSMYQKGKVTHASSVNVIHKLTSAIHTKQKYGEAETVNVKALMKTVSMYFEAKVSNAETVSIKSGLFSRMHSKPKLEIAQGNSVWGKLSSAMKYTAEVAKVVAIDVRSSVEGIFGFGSRIEKAEGESVWARWSSQLSEYGKVNKGTAQEVRSGNEVGLQDRNNVALYTVKLVTGKAEGKLRYGSKVVLRTALRLYGEAEALFRYGSKVAKTLSQQTWAKAVQIFGAVGTIEQRSSLRLRSGRDLKFGHKANQDFIQDSDRVDVKHREVLNFGSKSKAVLGISRHVEATDTVTDTSTGEVTISETKGLRGLVEIITSSVASMSRGYSMTASTEIETGAFGEMWFATSLHGSEQITLTEWANLAIYCSLRGFYSTEVVSTCTMTKCPSFKAMCGIETSSQGRLGIARFAEGAETVVSGAVGSIGICSSMHGDERVEVGSSAEMGFGTNMAGTEAILTDADAEISIGRGMSGSNEIEVEENGSVDICASIRGNEEIIVTGIAIANILCKIEAEGRITTEDYAQMKIGAPTVASVSMEDTSTGTLETLGGWEYPYWVDDVLHVPQTKNTVQSGGTVRIDP